MMNYKKAFCVSVLALTLGLGACSMTTPSQIEVGRLQVSEGYMTSAVMRDEIDDVYWGSIADDYMRNSDGPVNIYVSYPSDIMGANVKASRLAGKYKSALFDRGIDAVNTSIVPMRDADKANTVLVSFKNLKAEIPDECSRLTGRHGGETVYAVRDYKIGCENMYYTSKMVSDPADLLGRSVTRDADSRRAGNVVETYRTGEPYTQLESSSASGL